MSITSIERDDYQPDFTRVERRVKWTGMPTAHLILRPHIPAHLSRPHCLITFVHPYWTLLKHRLLNYDLPIIIIGGEEMFVIGRLQKYIPSLSLESFVFSM